MYGHERSLVQRFHDQPVVFIGVNSDSDPQRAKAVISQEGLAFRTWWDGGPEGAIAQRYHVQAWPAIYVLDGDGVIRFAHVRGQALDQAIETLLHKLDQPHS
jgi:hypothetical protein